MGKRELGLLILLLCLGGTKASGQTAPPGLCTVNLLNQSAFVRPDGSWTVPNVPSNMGRVRARVTCIQDGGTVSGSSDFFTVANNRMSAIPKVALGAGARTPVRTAVVAPTIQLTAAGATSQLTVTATYDDGSAADVTAATTGTTYATTNPRIATVGPDGLVTARASGRVIVSSLHEAILAAVAISVVTSGDADGDGIPDDLEIASGLDPANPVDALEDADGDGLTNRQELIDYGTAIRNPDTDGDGLRDGDEVDRYHTNPLLFDTDGDGISDGLEIQSGSDPLDPNSFNLGPILQSLTVQPATLDIVFNTAVGEASRRLDVKARLIDGTLLDVRRRRYGTSYSSSDLAVASFGAEDGVVFAGQDGTATVTVSLGSRSATTQVHVTSFSPQPLSFLPMPGFANGVDVAGPYAYVAAGSAGLVVVNASDPQAPFIAASLPIPGNANDLKVSGGYAYVAAGSAGLVIVDVRNPTAPIVAGRIDTPGTATDVALRGGRAYVADGLSGLFIADVTNPTAPLRLGAVDTPGNARGIDTDGRIAVVADDYAGLQVVDVSNPAAPVLLGSTHTRPADGFSHAASVALRGTLAYVADGAGFNLGGMRTVDLSDPTTPVVVGSTSDAFALTSVVLDGNLALASDVFFVNAVPIFDVGGTTPAFSAEVDFSRAPSFRDDNGNDVAVSSNGLVFMVGSRWDITDNGEWGDTALHIGRYKVAEDTAGIPPEMSLTAPAAGASARERDPLVVRASATDDIQVASVQFFADGVAVAEDAKAPYEASLRVPVGVASFTLTAMATDLGGNHTTSKPVVVTVIPDDKPKVSFLAPVAGGKVVEGGSAEMAVTATDDVRVESVELFVDGVSQVLLTRPPYRLIFGVAVGATQVTLQAVATDSAGQTATATQGVAVKGDLPPVVAILSPAAGSRVVEGAHLAVTAGVTDDVGVSQVHFDVDGQPAGDAFGPPYVFPLDVPAGATQLRLTATATDTLGQTASVESVLAVIPDPLTTAAGRVVDGIGQPLSGVTVDCLGLTGTTDAAGAFSVPGIPTLPGRVACSAQVVSGSDAALGGNSAGSTPVPGGVTAVGDIVVSAHLLYLGAGGGFDSDHPGRLLVLDESGTGRLLDWSRSFRPQGLSGLVFDGDNTLWATTQPEQGGVFRASQGPRARSSVTAAGTSKILRLDADTGATLAALGPFTDSAGGFQLGLQDLTFVPATGGLYALRAGFFGRAILSLDLSTQVARTLTPDLPFNATGLAAGPDGRLYLFVPGFGSNELWTIDPGSGAIVNVQPISGTVGASFGAEIGGMVLKPGTRTFVLTSISDGTSLYEVDLGTLAVTEASTPAGELFGAGLRALAFRPLSNAAGTVSTVRGLVADPDGQPVAGADIVSLGAATTTGPDGRFEIPGLTVRTGLVRVAVSVSGGASVLTPGVLPVAGGVTDLGTITLGAPACVTGTFHSNGCAQGPVSGTFDLYLDDGTGQLTLAGHVLPDPAGRFCAVLRRNAFYVARREDVECTCATVSPCQASLALTDPEAVGSCGDANAACQDLGNVFLDCDFFCGGD